MEYGYIYRVPDTHILSHIIPTHTPPPIVILNSIISPFYRQRNCASGSNLSEVTEPRFETRNACPQHLLTFGQCFLGDSILESFGRRLPAFFYNFLGKMKDHFCHEFWMLRVLFHENPQNAFEVEVKTDRKFIFRGGLHFGLEEGVKIMNSFGGICMIWGHQSIYISKEWCLQTHNPLWTLKSRLFHKCERGVRHLSIFLFRFSNFIFTFHNVLSNPRNLN